MKKLTVDDIEVPQGMRDAAYTASGGTLLDWLRAALLWLAENPIVPDQEDVESMHRRFHARDQPIVEINVFLAVEWQRRMFLRKQAALPEELKGLLYAIGNESNDRIIAAFELGKKVGAR